MKKLLIVLNIIAIAVLCLVCCTACKSKKAPIPSEYRGEYKDLQYGNVVVSADGKYVKTGSRKLLLGVCVIGGQTVLGDQISWSDTEFDYYEDKTFSFTTSAHALLDNITGNATFSGRIYENSNNYQMSIGCSGCNSNVSLYKLK